MDPIQIFVICFYLMGSCTLLLCLVYFLQELKAQRFSLKKTFNKFNTSWLICYIGVGASIIGDMAFTIPNSQLGTKIFMRLLSGWSLPMTLCGWLYYMYFRSNLVMADSPWQVRVKWMSIISVIVQIAAACYRTQGILVDPTASALPISHNIVTVISSLMVMGCAFFYCYFFTRYFHNAKVKSVGAHNRKGQIIAFYGNFSSAMAASALLIFLLRLAVKLVTNARWDFILFLLVIPWRFWPWYFACACVWWLVWGHWYWSSFV